MKPNARTAGLIVKREIGELFIEDIANHHSIHLNPTAAYIWEKCDGKKEITEIAREMEYEFGMKVDDRIVALAVGRLISKNLLDIVI